MIAAETNTTLRVAKRTRVSRVFYVWRTCAFAETLYTPYAVNISFPVTQIHRGTHAKTFINRRHDN